MKRRTSLAARGAAALGGARARCSCSTRSRRGAARVGRRARASRRRRRRLRRQALHDASGAARGTLGRGDAAPLPPTLRAREFEINCSHRATRPTSGPVEAIDNYCNYYFGRAASRSTPTPTRPRCASRFGARTDAADTREARGCCQREAARVPRCGESEDLRVTPAQLATAYAALFNGGGAARTPRRARRRFAPAARARVSVEPAQRALLLAGMRGAVATGRPARGAGDAASLRLRQDGHLDAAGRWRAQGWSSVSPGQYCARGRRGRQCRDVPADDVKLVVLVPSNAQRLGCCERASRLRGLRAHARSGRTFGDGTLNSTDEGARPTKESATLRVRLSRGDATLRLPLEDYGFGVLAEEGSVENEVGRSSPSAVAARTYAVHNLRRHARDASTLRHHNCQRLMPVRDERRVPTSTSLRAAPCARRRRSPARTRRPRSRESYFSAAAAVATADVVKLWAQRARRRNLRGVNDESCSVATEGWTE